MVASFTATAQANHHYTTQYPAADCKVDQWIVGYFAGAPLIARETTVSVRPPTVYAFDYSGQDVKWRASTIGASGQLLQTSSWRWSRAYFSQPAFSISASLPTTSARSGNVNALWNDWSNNNWHRVKIEVSWWTGSSWVTRYSTDETIKVRYYGEFLPWVLQGNPWMKTRC